MKKIGVHSLLILFCFLRSFAQEGTLDFDGQVAAFTGYLPQRPSSFRAGARYIPQLNIIRSLDSTTKIDGEFSVNLYGTATIRTGQTTAWNADLNPYRIWLRYARPRFELRGGLQKIDFGSATALRPLQWFNQIDPRDPLQITNGVYGLLGRYYFLNNANIWAWGLYGNHERRGLDVAAGNPRRPEFGSRFQLPVPKGELAFSWHRRHANPSGLTTPSQSDVPEDRFGIDGKWDLGIGLWIEAVYTHLHLPAEPIANQVLATIGADYTFGLGNGLNAVMEHLVFTLDKKAFAFDHPGQFTAAILAYPLSINDQLTAIQYYNWEAAKFSFFMNYQHQFPRITGYLMAFYIPPGLTAIQQTDWITPFSGPGLRVMLVYNH